MRKFNSDEKAIDQSLKKRILYALLFLAFFVSYSVLATVFLGHACPIDLLFGIPCPGCGMTRAVLALFKGDFVGAINMHPLVVALPFFAVLGIGAFFSARFAKSKLLTGLSVAGCVALVGVYIYRMVCFFPHTEPMTVNQNSLLFFLIRVIKGR